MSERGFGSSSLDMSAVAEVCTDEGPISIHKKTSARFVQTLFKGPLTASESFH